MKSKESVSELRRLSHAVGEFIRYWGFRKVHGAIWTQLYLSKQPLSGTDLASRLELSKALISPALTELIDWKLILQVDGPNEKTKLYVAEEDVSAVIRYVLKRREAKIMEKITAHLKAVEKKGLTNQGINESRYESMVTMVDSAQMMLTLLTESDDLFALPEVLNTKSL